MEILKVGRIDFLNILPIYYYFEKYSKNTVKIVNKVPAVLNAMLKNGEIDMGPISSFSYAKNADDYLLLPNLSVSSKGKVRSIFLFSKKPINALNFARIALTNTSETSIHLLKIILEKYYQYNIKYTCMNPNLHSMLEAHDAALLIGDDAFVDSDCYSDTLYRYDLGELWYEITGMSMTFAVWAVRKESLIRFSKEISEAYMAFLSSKKMGQLHIDKIIIEANKKFNFGNDFWKQYYSGLLYDFNSETQMGLEKYFNDAFTCGYLMEPVKVKIWSDSHVSI